MVEVHGDYFHVNPYEYKGKMSTLNYMQRKNMIRDKKKAKVCVANAFQYLCVWEGDLMTSPREVKRQLKAFFKKKKHAEVLLEDKKELYHKNIKHLDDFFAA